MKKKTMFKVLVSVSLAFVLTMGAFGQATRPFTQMEAFGKTMGTRADSITVGLDILYYVEPDPILNTISSAYDTTANNGSQGVQSRFVWKPKEHAGDGDGIQFDTLRIEASPDSAPAIKVRATAANSNPDSILVYEYAPGGGGCVGDSVVIPIRIFAAPSFNVNAANDGDTTHLCVTGSTAVELSSITDNLVSGGDYIFQIDSFVNTVDGDLNEVQNFATATNVYVNLAETNAGGTDVTLLNHNMVLRNDSITKYEFVIDGISDHISRKSDFLTLTDKTGATNSEYTYYAPTVGTRKVFFIYPAPSTGDIFYVPNDFDLN
jgi:hypothetical protein